MTTEHVVIVGRRPEHCEPLSRALVADGWEVRTCAGPARARCPLLTDYDCTLRDSAAAAIVYLNARGEPTASIPLVRCAAASSAPSVVVLEGQVDAPRLERGFAIVGSLRSPEVIAATLGGLLGVVPEQTTRASDMAPLRGGERLRDRRRSTGKVRH